MLWLQIEAALSPAFARKSVEEKVIDHDDLFGGTLETEGWHQSRRASAPADPTDVRLALSQARRLCLIDSSVPRASLTRPAVTSPNPFSASPNNSR